MPGANASIADFQQALISTSRDGAERFAKVLVARDDAGLVRKAELAGASDIVAGYAIGNSAPYMAIVASMTGEGKGRWSEAAWLSILELFTDVPAITAAVLSSGTVYLLLIDDEAPEALPSPGDPLFRSLRVRGALLDLGVEAALILDLDGPPVALTLHAASWKHATPLRVLEAARFASRSTGVAPDEVPVMDFYAASGLSSGSAALSSWLEAGVPSLGLSSPQIGVRPPEGELVDLASFALAFSHAVLGDYSKARQGISVSGDDVTYLRYPLPFGMVTLTDAVIVASTLLSLAALALALALGWLRGPHRTVSSKAVAGEALAAFGFSLVALLGSKALSAGVFAATGVLFGPEAVVSRDGLSLSVALALVIRVLGTISVYYAVSGLASKAGLLVDHRRVDAARAALALFFVDALVALMLFPAVVPFLLVAMALALVSSGTAATAALGLVVVGAVALPFFAPRVVAAIGAASGGPGSVASAMLDAGLRGLVATAAFVAPFGLWINISVSSASRIRRGHRTALFWLLGALLCAVAEAAVRLAPGSS
ncbi:MAG: hypothetical protein A2Y38_12550 [Spirochaetes bacterium GWB1_59_5]|nr:MAG: hypothetical protein A2Y38_12550 [Spirochaetes bacterium GWB1_59_5]